MFVHCRKESQGKLEGFVVTVRFGPFVLDSDRRQLARSDEVHLTPKAFDLLALLAAQAPRVVRKTELP
jgi:DNA-binding winged helix-turn-helix (wHTH) protein